MLLLIISSASISLITFASSLLLLVITCGGDKKRKKGGKKTGTADGKKGEQQPQDKPEAQQAPAATNLTPEQQQQAMQMQMMMMGAQQAAMQTATPANNTQQQQKVTPKKGGKPAAKKQSGKKQPTAATPAPQQQQQMQPATQTMMMGPPMGATQYGQAETPTIFCWTPQGLVPVQMDPSMFMALQTQYRLPEDQQSVMQPIPVATSDEQAAAASKALSEAGKSVTQVPNSMKGSNNDGDAGQQRSATGVKTAMVVENNDDLYAVPDELTRNTEEDDKPGNEATAREKPKTIGETYENIPNTL